MVGNGLGLCGMSLHLTEKKSRDIFMRSNWINGKGAGIITESFQVSFECDVKREDK